MDPEQSWTVETALVYRDFRGTAGLRALYAPKAIQERQGAEGQQLENTGMLPRPGSEPLDLFAMDLRKLREVKGVSYTDLAAQVSKLKVARGLHEAAARTPRSTVYNCFRIGRARIDVGLLRDIVLALTDSEAEAERWVDRYLEARTQSESLRRDSTTHQGSTTVTPRSVPDALEALRPTRLPWGTVAMVLISAVLINRLGMATVAVFGFSLFLDMIGTCLVAIALGPWYGVAVAVAYQGITLFTNFDIGALFVLVNITGALVWGYGVRRFKLGSDFSRFALLGVLVAVSCSAVGVPINMFLASIGSAQGLESVIGSLESMGLPSAVALFSANITTSIIDKLLASFIGLSLFVYLHRRYHFPADHMPLVNHLGTLRIAGKPGTSPKLV